MTNFWNNLQKPFFILAPMEDVTDVVFRHVIAVAASPDIFFTEFVNVSSYCNPKGIASTRGRLAFTSDEQPIVAQIWGTKPEEFAQMSKDLAEMGYAGIDINMGCPDKAVVRIGAGSALIRTPELAGQIIATTKAGGLPVSVKTRLGDLKVEEWHDWLEFLLRQDIANLTIHLRTRKEMSKVSAHYELIPEIKKLRDEIAPQTLLTINGDIRDRGRGEELAKKYGIDGIMIGRGIFQNPFAFEHITKPAVYNEGFNTNNNDTQRTDNIETNRHLQPELDKAPGPLLERGAKPSIECDIISSHHSKQELLDLLNLHLNLHDKYAAELEPRKFDPLKRFFKIYIRDFPGASELRDKLMHTKNTAQVREILKSLDD